MHLLVEHAGSLRSFERVTERTVRVFGLDAVLPQGRFTLPLYFEYTAAFTWAVSGAIVGARRGYDIVGVFVFALVSSAGGGLIRDGLLLHRTPRILTDATYLLMIVLGTLIVVFVSRGILALPRGPKLDKLIEAIDAIGTPAYAVVGMQLAEAKGSTLPGIILVGVISSVGGGLLRDVLANDEPRLFQPGQYSALLALGACGAFALFVHGLGWDPTRSALLTVAGYIVSRALLIRFHWRPRAVILPRDEAVPER